MLVLNVGEYITFVSGLKYSNWRKKMGRIRKEKKGRTESVRIDNGNKRIHQRLATEHC